VSSGPALRAGLELTGLELDSPVASIQGTLEFLTPEDSEDGIVVHACLSMADVGRCLDYWPLLRGHVTGRAVTR